MNAPGEGLNLYRMHLNPAQAPARVVNIGINNTATDKTAHWPAIFIRQLISRENDENQKLRSENEPSALAKNCKTLISNFCRTSQSVERYKLPFSE